MPAVVTVLYQEHNFNKGGFAALFLTYYFES